MKLGSGIIWIAALLAAGVVFAHMVPIRYFGPWSNSDSNDIVHVLGFATLAFIAAHRGVPALEARIPAALARYAVLAGALGCLGVAAEAAQYFTSRDANPFDVLRDFGGIAAGLSLHWALGSGTRGRIACVASAAVLLALGLYQPVMLLAAAAHARTAFPVIASFEGPLDLHAAFLMSVDARTIPAPPEWDAAGRIALLTPTTRLDFRGLAFTKMPRDWQAYSRLVFRVAAEATTVLTVRVNDMDYSGGYADRFNRDFEIGPVPQTIVIPLTDIESGPQSRRLNLRDVERVAIYLDHRAESFMLDDIRLE